MPKSMITLLLCALAGCASSPPSGYSICSMQPGTYACQIEQYRNADG